MKWKLGILLSVVLVGLLLFRSPTKVERSERAEQSAVAVNPSDETLVTQEKPAVQPPAEKEPAPAVNYYKDVPPLKEQVATLKSLSDMELKDRLSGVKQEMVKLELVERANKNELTEPERELFARLMHEESALKLVLLDRKLKQAEEGL